MKPTEKDLQTAREFLQGTDYAEHDSSYVTFNDVGGIPPKFIDLPKLLVDYLLYEEAAGLIKFTENQYAEDEQENQTIVICQDRYGRVTGFKGKGEPRYINENTKHP